MKTGPTGIIEVPGMLLPPPMSMSGFGGTGMGRRRILQAALGCLASSASLSAFSVNPVWGSEVITPPVAFWSAPRWVWLKRTGEEIRLTYWADGKLDPAAHQQISWFMRDLRFETLINTKSPVIQKAIRQGELTEAQITPWALMDPVVLDILYAHCAWLSFYGLSRALELTSGFRHWLTNAMTEGAARDSQHTKAGAADFFIPGVATEQVARFGIWLAGGGVGLYRSKNFIHVDRGRFRNWVKG